MKPRLLPRLGQCPSLGRSRGFICYLSKFCKILALGDFFLLSYQLEPRGGVLLSSRPTYLITSFLSIKFIATRFFGDPRIFFHFFYFFYFFYTFLFCTFLIFYKMIIYKMINLAKRLNSFSAKFD